MSFNVPKLFKLSTAQPKVIRDIIVYGKNVKVHIVTNIKIYILRTVGTATLL